MWLPRPRADGKVNQHIVARAVHVPPDVPQLRRPEVTEPARVNEHAGRQLEAQIRRQQEEEERATVVLIGAVVLNLTKVV